MSSPSRRSWYRLPPELRGPLLAGCVVFAAAWAFVNFAPWFGRWLYGDVRYYEVWSNLVTNHEVPYRDFQIEYPPLALVPLIAPVYARKLLGYHGTYYEWFRVEIAIL